MSSLNTLIKNCVVVFNGKRYLNLNDTGSTEQPVTPFFMGDAWNDIQTTDASGDPAVRVVHKEV